MKTDGKVKCAVIVKDRFRTIFDFYRNIRNVSSAEEMFF